MDGLTSGGAVRPSSQNSGWKLIKLPQHLGGSAVAGSANEGDLSVGRDNSIWLATLASSCVVAGVSHEFIHGQGLSRDGRLISGH